VERFCGEFLSPDGVGSLEMLGALDRVLETGPSVISSWRVRSRSGEIAGGLPGPALGVRRRRLDPALRAHAACMGAEVREGVRAIAVEAASSGVRVRTASKVGRTVVEAEVRAAHVIAATGGAARVGGLEQPARRGGWIGMKAHFRASAPADAVELYPIGGGYVGVAPVGDGEVSVCCLARLEAFRGCGARCPEDFLDRGARRNPAFRDVWRGLSTASGRWLTVAGMSYGGGAPRSEHVVHCGDAAARVAPFLGEGMAMALESGRLAARAVGDALAERTPGGAAALYAREWKRRFRRRFRLGRALQPLLLDGRGADLAVRVLRRIPAAADAVVAATRAGSLAALGASALSRKDLLVGHRVGEGISSEV
jgi:flavin-dependent dehydrogenase